ncbi:DNA polymerase IV [Anoxynatronum buryatiense]|uniref:DNA polymerase IV n=1 Tax=Anoxynatronum buryatiense TaxID=489973 RepID=A0AA45WX88_9CLOT|nr:DNA polymerase-4 [Anoxynatronum buryatiense]
MKTLPRIVFLVDMNAYYITCEMSRHPHLKGTPAAVAGDPQKRTGIILAANYEARACGVKTAMSLQEALKRCPGLTTVPPDHHYYSEKSREVMALLAEFSPCIEQNSIDEAWLDMTGSEKIFGPPEAAAQQIMTALDERLSLWCSVGIARNKFLSKMAADFKKPLGISTLWSEEVADKLWPLPVETMYGIGQKTAGKLTSLNISTIGDLAAASPALLMQHFGDAFLELQRKASGIDTAPVVPSLRENMKSIGRSTTLAEDAHDIDEIRTIFMGLAEDVAHQARQYGKPGNVVQITIKFNDFSAITRQVTLPTATHYTRELYEAGYQLLKKHWPSNRGVRLIGISLSGFQTEAVPQQLSIFDLSPAKATENDDRQRKQQKIDEIMDQVRLKHGTDKIARASLLHRKPKHP